MRSYDDEIIEYQANEEEYVIDKIKALIKDIYENYNYVELVGIEMILRNNNKIVDAIESIKYEIEE